MTLDELLKLARDQAQGVCSDLHDRMRLARAVLDLLGEAQPCGWEQPETAAGRVSWEPLGADVSPSEARAIAAILLRAADEAEANSVG